MFRRLVLAVLLGCNWAEEIFRHQCDERVLDISIKGEVLDFSVQNSHIAVNSAFRLDNSFNIIAKKNSHIRIYKIEAQGLAEMTNITNISSALRVKFAPNGDLLVLCGPNSFYENNHITNISNPLSERPLFRVLYTSAVIRCNRPYNQPNGPFFKPTLFGANQQGNLFFISKENTLQALPNLVQHGNVPQLVRDHFRRPLVGQTSAFAIHPTTNDIYELNMGYVIVFSVSGNIHVRTTAMWKHGLYQCSDIEVDKHGNVLIVAHGPDRVIMYPPQDATNHFQNMVERTDVKSVVLPDIHHCPKNRMQERNLFQTGVQWNRNNHQHFDIVSIEIDHVTDKLYVLKWIEYHKEMAVEEWRYTEPNIYEHFRDIRITSS